MKLETVLAIVVILGVLFATWVTVANCDGTIVRGLFWYECIPWRTLK